MKALAFVIGLLIIAAGTVGLLVPSALISIAQHAVTRGELYVMAAGRVAVGLVLILAASRSRAPRTLRVLGVIALVAGLATPLVGVERVRAIMEWFSQQESGFFRLPAVFALVLGGFIAYACAPARRAA